MSAIKCCHISVVRCQIWERHRVSNTDILSEYSANIQVYEKKFQGKYCTGGFAKKFRSQVILVLLTFGRMRAAAPSLQPGLKTIALLALSRLSEVNQQGG